MCWLISCRLLRHHLQNHTCISVLLQEQPLDRKRVGFWELCVKTVIDEEYYHLNTNIKLTFKKWDLFTIQYM